jgi:hypothetical protein
MIFFRLESRRIFTALTFDKIPVPQTSVNKRRKRPNAIGRNQLTGGAVVPIPTRRASEGSGVVEAARESEGSFPVLEAVKWNTPRKIFAPTRLFQKNHG